MSRNRFMSSSNPFMSEKTFAKNSLGIQNSTDVMTVGGAVNKSLILAAILIATAVFSAGFFLTEAYAPYLNMIMIGSVITGFVMVMITYSKPTIAHITAPVYAVVEGVFLGIISGYFAEMISPTIVFNAVLLTALCLVSMLVAYKTGLIKATKKFRSMIVTATGAIMMIYLVQMGLGFFGMNIPYLHQSGMMGIGISLFIIGIAVLNLILDFDNIEKGAAMGAAKNMEWVTSLGLLVTLVWIYVEILRLLAMFSSSD